MTRRGMITSQLVGRAVRWRITTSSGWLQRSGLLAAAVLLCLCSATPGAAQSVSGRLLDDATDVAIAGAVVMLLDLDGQVLSRALTPEDGAFELAVPAPGQYRVRAQRIGYVMATSPPLDLVQSRSLVVEFRLSAAAVPLAPITVVGRERARDPRLEFMDYYERKATYGKEGMGFAHFLDGEELERRPAFRVFDLLRDLPGIHVGRGCVSFFLDGAPLVVMGGIDDMIIPSAVVAIEVYWGRVMPVEYLTLRSGCPVVAVWTGIRPH